jgi:perosamine synthetase
MAKLPAVREAPQAPPSIPITKPLFGPEELRAVQLPLESGWVVQGPFVKQFEERFSAFTGAAFSVATSSCTTALHIAVVALGLKPGDEVIVPAFTWVSTANIVESMGARPVFCDVRLDTFNVDVRAIEKLVTQRTVGVIPVHLFGLCADMEPILEFARRRGLWVIEDAACGLGGWYQGRHAGTLGDVGAFSFHPRKSITTGEGGMITTQRADLARFAVSLRDHGASRSDLARHTESQGFLLPEYNVVGFNYRMTDIQGALGVAQMERLAWIMASRTRLARRYDERLAGHERLHSPSVPEGLVHGYQAYVCLFGGPSPSLGTVEAQHIRRNQVMERLARRGIATRQGTHAPIALRYYAEKYGLKPEQFPNAYLADRLTLALPLYPQMTDAEQELVCQQLVRALDG